MLKKAIICLLALTIIVLGFGFLRVFYVYNGCNGTLLWDGDAAYLFLNLDSLGYRMTYLQYMGQTVKEVFGLGRVPSDKRYSSVVITIKASNVNSYVLNNMHLSEYFVVDGRVLSGDQDTGILWRWDENHYERATSQDQYDLTKVASSHMPGPDFDDVDGWYKRVNIFSRKDIYAYMVNLKESNILLTARREHLDDLSLDLTRAGGTNVTIWQLDGHLRKVRNAEYQRVFGKD